ncbi:50S ribosomal protein L33, partial [Nocardiopsis alba]
TPDRLTIKKFCPNCRKHNEHREALRTAPTPDRGIGQGDVRCRPGC